MRKENYCDSFCKLFNLHQLKLIKLIKVETDGSIKVHTCEKNTNCPGIKRNHSKWST